MRRRAVVAGLTAISLVGLKRPVRAELPVPLGFAELQEAGGGTYSAKARELAGRRVAMRGRLAPHGEEAAFLLLTEGGLDDAEAGTRIVAVHPAADSAPAIAAAWLEVTGRLELGEAGRVRLREASLRPLA
jgi:hypothetical protein